jgi:hypothetical protein
MLSPLDKKGRAQTPIRTRRARMGAHEAIRRYEQAPILSERKREGNTEMTVTASTDTSATPVERADELLRQMTLEEKAMQLVSVVPLALLSPDGPMHDQLDSLIGRGIGHVAGIGLLGHKLPDEIAKSVNAIQRYLLTETRLKIPAIFHKRRSTVWWRLASPHFPPRSGWRRRGTPTLYRRWPTSGARCGRWECCTRWRR